MVLNIRKSWQRKMCTKFQRLTLFFIKRRRTQSGSAFHIRDHKSVGTDSVQLSNSVHRNTAVLLKSLGKLQVTSEPVDHNLINLVVLSALWNFEDRQANRQGLDTAIICIAMHNDFLVDHFVETLFLFFFCFLNPSKHQLYSLGLKWW